MKDCHFDGLGDDALNIHSQAGEIAETDGEKMHFIYRDRSLRSCPLGEKWAQGGDLIRFYDRNTFLEKGTFRLVSYDGGDAVVTGHFRLLREKHTRTRIPSPVTKYAYQKLLLLGYVSPRNYNLAGHSRLV